MSLPSNPKCEQPVFEFLGPGDGKGSKHIVISRSGKGAKVQSITTWSLIDDGLEDENGWTWEGPIEDFNTQFKRIK